MPLWLIILGGVAIYLLAKNSSAQTQASATPVLSQTVPPQPTSSYDDSIPTPQSAVPAPMQMGQAVSLPVGTKLYSDSKLTKATGSVLGTGPLSVSVTATSVAADGSISGSYTDGAGNTYWFAQPGT
jgi:hypothetical protein